MFYGFLSLPERPARISRLVATHSFFKNGAKISSRWTGVASCRQVGDNDDGRRSRADALSMRPVRGAEHRGRPSGLSARDTHLFQPVQLRDEPNLRCSGGRATEASRIRETSIVLGNTNTLSRSSGDFAGFGHSRAFQGCCNCWEHGRCFLLLGVFFFSGMFLNFRKLPAITAKSIHVSIGIGSTPTSAGAAGIPD